MRNFKMKLFADESKSFQLRGIEIRARETFIRVWQKIISLSQLEVVRFDL